MHRVSGLPLAGTVLGCILALGGVGRADQPATRLGEVVTASTTVVGEETLSVMPRGVGAEEALRFVPGVKVDNQANGERVHLSIRGTGLLTERGIRGVTILLDGLPLNDPSGVAPDLFDVDWSNVERIEVLRGPASTLYGGSSAGGVINIVTKDGGAQTWSGDGTLSGGSFDFWKGRGAIGGSCGPTNYRLDISRNSSDGWRTHTAFAATKVYGKLKWDVSPSTRLHFIIAGTDFFNQNAEGLNHKQFNEDPSQPNPDATKFNELQRTRRATVGVVGHTGISANRRMQHDLTYRLYYRWTKWDEAVPSTVQARTGDTAGLMLQYNLHVSKAWFANHFSAGVDLGRQLISDRKHPNLGEAKEGPELVANQLIRQTGVGLLLLDRVELGPKWGINLGLRYDRVMNSLDDGLRSGGVDLSGTANFDRVTGRAGVSFNLAREVGLYANWSQGFMPPAIEELANNPDKLGGLNQNIKPATSMGGEIGARGTVANQLTYEVAGFYVSTNDDFGRYRSADRPLETFHGNVGTSRRLGLEVAAKWRPVRALDIQVAYTLSDFRYPEIDSLFGQYQDKMMPNAPVHQLAANVAYVLWDRWVFGAALEAVSRSWVNQKNDLWVGSYALLDPRLGFRWKGAGHRGELVAHVRNALHMKYVAFSEPDPDGNSFQPGPPTELFLTAHVQFSP